MEGDQRNTNDKPMPMKEEEVEAEPSHLQKEEVNAEADIDGGNAEKKWYRQIVLEKQLSIIVHSDRAAIDVAIMIIKTFILINAGALIAAATFLERDKGVFLGGTKAGAPNFLKIHTRADSSIYFLHISTMFVSFCEGLACSVVMAVIAFGYQSYLTGKFQRTMKNHFGDIKSFDKLTKKGPIELIFISVLFVFSLATLYLFIQGLNLASMSLGLIRF